MKLSFQYRVLLDCFGVEITSNRLERNKRFLEEVLELVQACGATKEECINLVDYVYGLPSGEVYQEVEGVIVTLAALCLAQGVYIEEEAERELERIWTRVKKIREKQISKRSAGV